MINVKKLAVIATIAILFGIFIFSVINAIYEEPRYSDFCGKIFYPGNIRSPLEVSNCSEVEFSKEEADSCAILKGEFTPIYENSCITKYECTTCNREYDSARKSYNFYVFIMSSIFGLIAVILSIYLYYEEDSLKEWVLLGLLIGGLAAIFIGTGRYFSDLHRVLRPIIIFIEIVLVILVAYKKVGTKEES